MEFPLDVRHLHTDRGSLVSNDVLARAKIRQENQHFQVDEILGFELAGEGEHLYIQISKDGQNTAWVKEQFAAQLNLNPRDIGHSGLKDRHAITSQWLSIYLPKSEPELGGVEIEGVQILQTERHRQKLKPGMHESNRFKIRLTDFVADKDRTETILNGMKTTGFPNYFGNQRFGRGGGNLPKAWQLLKQRRLNRHKKKSIYLSSLRSFLFNRVVDAYISDTGNTSVSNDITGPLWGRGRLSIPQQQAEFEQVTLEPWKELCEALEYSGLQQERRHLFVMPDDLGWKWLDDQYNKYQLELNVQLPSGSYATSLLRDRYFRLWA